VRIESLEVSGLRSHRGNPPTTLDLSDKSLVAIVGHTGAGKSSLLEAVTFAFFGEATYGGKAYGELSSDGRTEISVRMTFTVGDDCYQLVRVVTPNRNGVFGAKETWLRRLDASGNPVTHTDGVRNVDAAVSALLGGMSREQFCQAVLLVQNRFAALLEADPRIRNTLLDALLGLAALEKTRDGLRIVRRSAQRNIDRLEGDRNRFSADPAGDVRRAKAAAKAMAAVADQAETGASQLGKLATTADTLGGEAADLARLAAMRATKTGPDGPTRLSTLRGTLTELCVLDEQLAGDARDADAARTGAASRIADAERTLSAAAEAHGPAGRHKIIAERLDQLGSLLADRPGQADACVGASEKCEALRNDLVAATAAAERCVELVAAHQADELQARQDHQARFATLAEADRSVAAVADAAGRLAVLVNRAGPSVTVLSEAEEAAAAADAALARLLEQRDAATAALAAARRADAAAAASHDCRVGDACPVCGRALPGGWTAPGGGDFAAAAKALDKADKAAKKATDAQRSGSERLVTALTKLRASITEVTGAHTELQKTAQANRLAGIPALPAALEVADETPAAALRVGVDAAAALVAGVNMWVAAQRDRLEPDRAALDAASARAARALDVLDAAQSAKGDADKVVQRLTTAVEVAVSQYEAAQKAVADTERRITTTLAGIDERWRALLNLDAATPLAEARTTLAADEALVDAAVAELHDALAARTAADQKVATVAADRAKRVDGGVAVARVSLVAVDEIVNDLAGRLGETGQSEPASLASASELLAYAVELSAAAARLADVAVDRAARLRAEVAELLVPGSVAVAALVEAMDAADPDGEQLGARPDRADPFGAAARNRVQQVVGAAKRLVAEAKQAAADAAEQVRTASELDRRVKALSAWRTNLDGAIEVLKKEAFPAWARNLRMADLVETASELLAEMTSGRYRFDPNLLISDEMAGIVRKASTLSGGEKFEAALALALGVSEIAGRSGIRVDTLFLDEGFAGLDQAHLNRALDALENQVEAGRCIVLITHIGSVADRIKDVLLIEPDGVGGSTTRWLNEEERFELGADLDLAVP
jgi:exonuclease SbcC